MDVLEGGGKSAHSTHNWAPPLLHAEGSDPTAQEVFHPSSYVLSYHLHVCLLTALHQLVEGRGSKVVVGMNGVQPLQRLHDDLLQHKRAQHPLGCPHTELVHVVHSWGAGEGHETGVATTALGTRFYTQLWPDREPPSTPGAEVTLHPTRSHTYPTKASTLSKS